MPRTVAVIIPSYNYGRFIAITIRSVLEQTYPAVEIIVVDDGSTDDTADIVAGFGDRVKYIRQENAGVCAARNRGVAESTGELIAFLDADDLMEPDSLEEQAARFAEDVDVGLVHCGLRQFDSDTGATIDLQQEGAEDAMVENLLLWEGATIPGPGAVMVSRKAFDAVGGFDTTMKVGEDWDFCYRVAQKFKVRFVPKILLHYRIHNRAAHWNVAEMERGMSRFYEKAFSTDDERILKLRKRAYGNFHKIMAGSYFRSGDYGQFVKHAFHSILLRWRNLGYFLKFPVRRLTSSGNRLASAPDPDA